MSPDFLVYMFYSQGPKGKIKKVIRYTQIVSGTSLLFNLSFGDWDEQENEIDDLVTTNNNDAEKVLATVASTVIRFFEHYPGGIIYAKGSTASRTRLYQMGINRIWNEIEKQFELYGVIESGELDDFKPNKNYIAFVLRRKNQ